MPQQARKVIDSMSKPTVVEETRLYASHHQFYVQDSKPRGNPGEETFWTRKAFENRLAIGDGLIAIGTGSYDFVKVRVEYHRSKPKVNLAQWDHVTECDLSIQTGLILVFGCLSMSGIFFDVEPANYRARALHANLAESEQEVPAGWSGDYGDWYLVQFWRSRPSRPRILKRRMSQI